MESFKPEFVKGIALLTKVLTNGDIPQATYLAKTEAVAELKVMLANHKDSLLSEDSNTLEADILSRATQVNKSPRESFICRQFLIQPS